MTSELSALLEDPRDFALCDGLFCRIVARYGSDIDASALNEPEQTVYFVWGSFGIIGNGGFQYLLEGDVKGDPDYRRTAEAYHRIRSDTAVDAFDRVLAVFPKGRLPADVARRIRHYRGQFERFPTPLDIQFFSAKQEIERGLAAYIRTHANAFAHLA